MAIVADSGVSGVYGAARYLRSELGCHFAWNGVAIPRLPSLLPQLKRPLNLTAVGQSWFNWSHELVQLVPTGGWKARCVQFAT